MEKNNGKIVAVAALVVAIIALSVGFAAFATTLNISGNAVAEAPADTVFAPNVNYVAEQNVSPRCYATSDTTNKADVTTGDGYSSGTASAKDWTGIVVPLNSDNNYSVTCEAKIGNTSDYTAYLTNITGSALTCASVGTGTAAASNPNGICDGTTVTVNIGSSSGVINGRTAMSNPTISSTSIAATSGTEIVKVTITYDGTAPDGDVRITIPNIGLDFSTVAP